MRFGPVFGPLRNPSWYPPPPLSLSQFERVLEVGFRYSESWRERWRYGFPAVFGSNSSSSVGSTLDLWSAVPLLWIVWRDLCFLVCLCLSMVSVVGCVGMLGEPGRIVWSIHHNPLPRILAPACLSCCCWSMYVVSVNPVL